MAKMDTSSNIAKKLNNDVISTLYNTVPHPIASYIGPTSFREADGGGNNLQTPDMGRAGMPYARSVQGKDGLPPSSLPDPGLIFDTILKRKGVSIYFSLYIERSATVISIKITPVACRA